MASSDRFVAVGKLLHAFNHLVSVTKLRVIGHLVSVINLHVFNPLESVTKLHIFNHLASVAKPQVFYYLVSDAKIFDIIYKLSPLLECDSTVSSPLEMLGHPRASPRVTLLFSGRQTVGSHSNKGDNCTYKVIILLSDKHIRTFVVYGFVNTHLLPVAIEVLHYYSIYCLLQCFENVCANISF
jgi:hypothetical protein